MLSGRWRNIIVVNVHAPSEEKSDESKDRLLSSNIGSRLISYKKKQK